MQFDSEDVMYKALAEILDVDLWIIQLIEPYIGEDTGSSKEEWHYGYYVEIPSYESLDKTVQEEIEEQIDIETFPFGQTLYFTDGELSETKADPLGWRTDFEAEEYYQKNPLQKDNVIDELYSISKKLRVYDDAINTKAFLFSAFSITESYVRSLIWDKMPDLDSEVKNTKLRKILKKHLYDKLSRTSGREELYKEFTSKTLKKIPFSDPYRNSLAHDIGQAQVIEGDIIVKDKNDKECRHNIDAIINNLIVYVQSVDN